MSLEGSELIDSLCSLVRYVSIVTLCFTSLPFSNKAI